MFQCFILLFRVTYLVCVPLLFNNMMEPARSSTPATATHHQLCVSLSLCYSYSPKPTEIQIHSVLQPISLQLSTETCLASYSFFRLEDSSWSLFLYEQYNLFRFRYVRFYYFIFYPTWSNPTEIDPEFRRRKLHPECSPNAFLTTHIASNIAFNVMKY